MKILHALIICIPVTVFSAPLLDTVTQGQAQVSYTDTHTTINQQSAHTAINWQSFNVAENHAVSFNQPNTSSIAVNNILDQNPSQILGTINANGRIVLLNANGFYIGKNATISADTFIAAATNLQNTSYDSAANVFTVINEGSLTGSIAAHGTIHTNNRTELKARRVELHSTAAIQSPYISIRSTQDISLHSRLIATEIDIFADRNINGGGELESKTSRIRADYVSLNGRYQQDQSIQIQANKILLNNDVDIIGGDVTIAGGNYVLLSATIYSNSLSVQTGSRAVLLNADITAPEIAIGSREEVSNRIEIYGSNLAGSTILIFGNDVHVDSRIIAPAGFVELSATQRLQIDSFDTIEVPGGTLLLDPRYIIITDVEEIEVSTTDLLLNLFTQFYDISDPALAFSYPAEQRFGDNVVLSENYLVIGAGGNTTTPGTVYVVDLNSFEVMDLRSRSDLPADIDSASFGASVAVNDQYIAIGAPDYGTNGEVFLFRLGGLPAFSSNCNTINGLISPWCRVGSSIGTPTPYLEIASRNGADIALNDTHLLIGSPGSGSTGNAYLFTINSTPSFTSTCVLSGRVISRWCDLSQSVNESITGLTGSAFGSSVALNNDYAAISTRTVGVNMTFLYRLDGTFIATGACARSGILDSPWCQLLSSGGEIAINSTHLLYTAPSTVTNTIVQLYNIEDNVFEDTRFLNYIAAAAGLTDRIDLGLALSENYALIGTPGFDSDRGNVYLFDINNTQSTTLSDAVGSQLITNLPNTGSAINLGSGNTLAINDRYAFIGVPNRNNNVESGAPRGGTGFLYDIVENTLVDFVSRPLELPIVNNIPTDSLLGSSVAILGDIVLVGASGFSFSRGNVYLYNLANSSWLDLATTTTNLIQPASNFSFIGSAVALTTSHAIIGASGANDGRGGAFTYNLNSGEWTDLSSVDGSVIPALSPGAAFASNIAAAGSNILFSAPGSNTAFTYNLTSRAWVNLAMTASAPVIVSTNIFGSSIAISDNYIAIGAAGTSGNRGNAFVYNYTADVPTWINVSAPPTPSTLVSNLNPGSAFGASININENHGSCPCVFIGADGVDANRGSLFVYYPVTGTITNLATPLLPVNSFFGRSLSSHDTATGFLVIGAPGHESRGTFFIYDYGTTILNYTAFTTSAYNTRNERFNQLSLNSNFASAVATSGNRTVLAIPGENRILILDASLANISSTTDEWINPHLFREYEQGTPINFGTTGGFGYSVALNSNYAAITSLNSANVYLYELATGTWQDIRSRSDLPSIDFNVAGFGFNVALNDNYALFGLPTANIVGSTNTEGSAILFRLDGTAVFSDNCATNGELTAPSAWCHLTDSVGNPITDSNIDFGDVVALNNEYAVIADSSYQNSSGNVYIYRIDGTAVFSDNCATNGELTAPSAWCDLRTSRESTAIFAEISDSELFGASLAVNSTLIAIGQPGDNSNVGNVFLYQIDGNNLPDNTCDITGPLTTPWCSLVTITTNPFSSLGAITFGQQLAVNEETLAISASMAGADGDVYLYRLDNTAVYDANCLASASSVSAWCNLSQSSLFPGFPGKAAGTNANFGSGLSLSSDYLLIGARNFISTDSVNTGAAYLYRLDGSNVFADGCNIINLASSPWCILSNVYSSAINDNRSFSGIGEQVALSNDFILISSSTSGINRGDALLIEARNLIATSVFRSNDIESRLLASNVRLEASEDITIATSLEFTGSNVLSLISGDTVSVTLDESNNPPTLNVANIIITAQGDIASPQLILRVTGNVDMVTSTGGTAYILREIVPVAPMPPPPPPLPPEPPIVVESIEVRTVISRDENGDLGFIITPLTDLLGDLFEPIFESLDFIYDVIQPELGSVFESLLEGLGSSCNSGDLIYITVGGFACSNYGEDITIIRTQALER